MRSPDERDREIERLLEEEMAKRERRSNQDEHERGHAGDHHESVLAERISEDDYAGEDRRQVRRDRGDGYHSHPFTNLQGRNSRPRGQIRRARQHKLYLAWSGSGVRRP